MAHQYMETEIGDGLGAWSLKKVRSAYSGDCIKVRRSSDDTTLDIGFSGDELDVSAFETFVGGGTGFIDTWYDQVGSFNLTQAVTGTQPYLYKDPANEKYTIRFVGTKNLRYTGALSPGSNVATSVVWRAAGASASSRNALNGGLAFQASGGFISPWFTVSNAFFIWRGSSLLTRGVWNDRSWRHHQFIQNNGTTNAYEFASSIVDNQTMSNFSYNDIRIGDGGFGPADMDVSEIFISDSVVDPGDVWPVIKNNYGADMFSYENVYLNIGDSISSSRFTGLGNEWDVEAYENQAGISRWFQKAVGGEQLDFWNTNISELTFYASELTRTGTANAIIFCGTNDMHEDDIDGTATFTRLITLIDALKSGGFNNVLVVTMLDRFANSPSQVVFDARREVFNDLIVANTEGKIDVVVDTRGTATLEDHTNSTYFAGDLVHLKGPGAEDLGELIGPALSSLPALPASSVSIKIGNESLGIGKINTGSFGV